MRASAERVYQTLDVGGRGVARQVFVQLSRTSDGKLVRRPSTRSVLRTGDQVDEVLEAFAAQRLLTLADNGVVDIAHEELLRSWTRLRDWLRPGATDQALHRALLEDVQTWEHHKREHSYLYRGGQLVAVEGALRRWSADPVGRLPVTAAATEFLRASQRRSRLQRMLYRTVAAVVAVLLVLFAGAATVAVRNSDRANRQHELALSRQLAAQSRAAPHRVTAERLAAAALRVADTVEASRAAALLADYRSVLGSTNFVTAVAFSPDGTLLAAGTTASEGNIRERTLLLWDPAAGKSARPRLDYTEPVTALAFSPDGRQLAVLSDGNRDRGAVQVWDSGTGQAIGPPFGRAYDDGGVRGTKHALAFSPNGAVLAVASGDDGTGTVTLWNPHTGQPAGDPIQLIGTPNAVAFSPDGARLVTGVATEFEDAEAPTLTLWDPATARSTGAATGFYDTVDALAYSPDGRILATVGEGGDATVRLWNPASARPIGVLATGHAEGVRHLAFSPDGRYLAAADAGNDAPTTALWKAATGRSIGPPLPDTVWLAKLNERGMLRPSFVPPQPIRNLRDYTRLRLDLTTERSRHKQRMEKLLEDALIKVSTVATDIFGASGRAMIQALIAGQRDPYVLADLARGRLRVKHAALVQALTGRFDDHHGELAAVLLDQIDKLTAHIDQLTTRIDALIAALPATTAPTGADAGAAVPALQRLDEITGVGRLNAQVIIAEIGLDMSRFPTAAHLVSWARLSPRTIQSGTINRSGKAGKGNPYLPEECVILFDRERRSLPTGRPHRRSRPLNAWHGGLDDRDRDTSSVGHLEAVLGKPLRKVTAPPAGQRPLMPS